MILYTTIVIALVTVANAASRKNPRILGGNDTLITDHPYMVSIEYDNYHKCGGSILSQNYILTAAHCLPKKYNLDVITIRAGSSFKDSGGSVHTIDRHTCHEQNRKNTDGSNNNDVAVVKIKPPFVFDNTRQPIKLFNSNETIEPGTMGIVSGWGKTRKRDWNRQLQSVAVPVLEKNLCNTIFVDKTSNRKPGEICASYLGIGRKDACVGDSGGPLVINGRQAGIVSWGVGCGLAWFPGVYVDVAYFREWIDKHVQY